MDGKATKGPWVAQREAAEWLVLDGDASSVIRKIVARIPSHLELDAVGEITANARLIAAAPALLEALEKAEALLERIWQLEYTPSQLMDAVTAWRSEHHAHKSDCAVHNEPAYPNGECSCGVTAIASAGVRK